MESGPTLLVLAAGMGSRYGGLKQLDPIGPHGETLLDYSVYDAIRAGFGKIVFVIRRDIETPFRKTIGKRYANLIDLDYAFQELEGLPNGTKPPAGRVKPWGTGHAILAAQDLIKGPFAVINADDYYGADAYRAIAEYFALCKSGSKDPLGMVGYALSHTLSEHGSVNRGLCIVNDGQLLSIEEIIDIDRDRNGTILGENPQGKEISLVDDTPVSMNFWGFSDEIFPSLEAHFIEFLNSHGSGLTSEFYIPAFIDLIISKENAQCDVLQTSANWFGMTYPGDKPFVQAHIRNLINSGTYPSPLHG